MRILGNARLLQLAVAAGIVAMCSSDALARSRGSQGSYGSSGSYGSYGSSGSYGSYGSSGSYASNSYGSYGSSGSYASSSYGSSGSHGRQGLFARWHAKKAARKSGSYGSYGSSSYGSSGSSGSYGSYSVSYGSSGSSGSYGSSYIVPAESYGEPATVVDPAQVTPEIPVEPSASNAEATIFVSVPAEAKIFVNDRPTTSTGVERQFVSRGLRSGLSYAYNLRVEFEKDGQPVVEDKIVRLNAGDSINLAFGGAESAAPQTATTEVKLHVPAEAKVTLAGAATEQTGELRTFTTNSLAAGQKWEGYVVRVELQRDGQMLTEEKTLTVEGGQAYELNFDFAPETVKVVSVN
jgi:uncharacterized protein (TIGR03000 family)